MTEEWREELEEERSGSYVSVTSTVCIRPEPSGFKTGSPDAQTVRFSSVIIAAFNLIMNGSSEPARSKVH